MITVDLSNVWGQVSLPNLLVMEKEVFDAHNTLTEKTGAGSDYLGWMDLPRRQPSDKINRIAKAAEKIRAESEVCVVVGIGGSCLGARAAIELLQGPNRNLARGRGDPLILFAGNSLSTRHWNELMELLDGRDFSLIAISKSGATLEPAVAFRELRWILERRYGTDGAAGRIYAVTDPIRGTLRKMAEEYGWETFSIPRNVGGRYAVLTPVGLLPMAVAGIDIMQIMNGAMDAKENFDIRSFENPVWQYAALRNLLYRRGNAIEILESFEPGFRAFGSWWQKLFGESEGKDGKGLFPVTAELTADLHSLGQIMQQGKRNFFETIIRFDPPQQQTVIRSDANNLDGLNYLTGKTLDFLEEQAWQSAVDAHVDGGVPILTIDCGPLCDRTVGELFYYLELSCAVSAYILGVNPFNQPGVELYKQNLFRLIGKPCREQK